MNREPHAIDFLIRIWTDKNRILQIQTILCERYATADGGNRVPHTHLHIYIRCSVFAVSWIFGRSAVRQTNATWKMKKKSLRNSIRDITSLPSHAKHMAIERKKNKMNDNNDKDDDNDNEKDTL